MAQGPTDLVEPAKQYSNSLKFVENAFLAFLQAIFSTRRQGYYKYDDDESITEISIEGQRTDNLKNVNTRPKITVARGPVSLRSSGINNMVGQQNLSRAGQRFATIREGSVGISCFSREELEADQIAELVVDAIDSMRNALQTYGFLQIQAMSIGQRALVKGDSRDELFVTPILIKVLVTKNYKSEYVDPVRLRQILYEYFIKPVDLRIPIKK